MGGWIGGSGRFGVPGPSFPVVEATNVSYIIGSNPTNHNLPASIQVGDLLLLFVRVPDQTLTTPSGWALLHSFEYGQSNTTYAYVFAKTATGSEGSTVAITSSGTSSQQSVAVRISGWSEFESAAANGSSSTGVDPPNLGPTWGNKETVWVAVGWANAAVDPTGTPANYTDKVSSGAGVVASRRALKAASENPGSYTQSGAFGWYAVTVGVRGLNT